MSKRQREKIDVVCAVCNQPKSVVRGSYEQVVKRNGFYRCRSCAPQRTKAFWTGAQKKDAHAAAIKASAKYYAGIATRDLSGAKNGMFGRKHTSGTSTKMSLARTGKLGENATAWKGGKGSFCSRVKRLIYTRYNWYVRCLTRDGFKCTKCSATKQLDVHHLVPVYRIIKGITENVMFENDNAKLEFVISDPMIADKDLTNGITLCRQCHRAAHRNWGSHEVV